MEGVCPKCKLAATYKYWHELPKTFHKFFKVMPDDFEHQLRIPKKFTECFNGKLERECTLRGPSGKEWKVLIERTDEGDIVMSDGWERFVTDHGVRAFDFLTFRYLRDSTFKVSIFNATGCEREEAYFPMTVNLRTTCTSTLHGSESGGFDCLFEHDDQSGCFVEDDGLGDQDSESSSEELNEISKATGKKKKVTSYEDLDISEKEGEEVEEEESSYEGDKEWGLCSRPKRRRGESSQGKQSQRRYISNRRSITDEEKQRASEMAMSHIKSRKSSGVPMFRVTMLQTNVSIGFNLTIPKEWALKHMLREPHEVELKVPDQTDSCTVGCRWTRSEQCQIRAKWAAFVLENNLEEHDVCVFERVQKGKPGGKRSPVFNVHIFRVVAEFVPLTVTRTAV